MSFEVPIVSPSVSIPRYLYRTTSNKSQGFNSLERFESAAVHNNESSVFWKSDLEARRQMVKLHLEWKTERGYFSSDLISWTNTLLFALKHAIREYHQGWRDIKIYILDTWVLSQLDRSNIFPAASLVERFGVYVSFPYTTEFLAIGRLDTRACCYSIPLETMFAFNPEMIPDPNALSIGLASAVNSARNRFWEGINDFPEDGLSKARLTACCFRPKFQLPFFLAWLSLEKRPVRSPSLNKEIKRFITTTSEKAVNDWFLKQDSALDRYNQVELVQFKELLDEAFEVYHQNSVGTSVDDIAQLASNLSLTPGHKVILPRVGGKEVAENDCGPDSFHESDTESFEDKSDTKDVIEVK